MKRSVFIPSIFLMIWYLTSCAQVPMLAPGATPTVSLESAAVVDVELDLPDVKLTAQEYLEAWKDGDYEAMYALLTSLSQDAISEGEFSQHYTGVTKEATLTGLDYEIMSALTKPDSAQVSYRVTLHSVLVGDISREILMNFSFEGGEWRIQWDDTLILPELKGGNYLAMQRQGYIPSRANIYDRRGLALVAQADATAIGLYPDQVLPEQADELFELLAGLTGLNKEYIQSQYEQYPKGSGWYLPLTEVAADLVAEDYDLLSTYSGLVMRQYKSRYYFDGGVAPHVVGYVSAIMPEEVDEYNLKGYQQDERVGRSGIEQWGEEYLAGKRGGALYVINAQGQPVTRLAEAPADPSQAIYTTLDREYQRAGQLALSNFTGSIVVLERDTGRVLAMVSTPGYNPNAFEPINFNSPTLLSEIYNNEKQPMLNRATQGLYPLGSVFKIITMAAGLESGQYSASSTYQCGYIFDELPGAELYDWTYDYYLRDGRTIPSGLLTLPEGLMRSCNPYFWHIGLDLYNSGLTTEVSEMARGFGLGGLTDIRVLDEDSGSIPDPVNAVDAVNMAIGQGSVQVTPLQAARFAAAVGNGGTLYRPQVVEKISLPDGEPTSSFKSEAQGKLPVSRENLRIIQDAMVGVIRNEKPRGTAWHRFTGLDIPVAGKTGTAQSGGDRPHAWFVGYTFAERADKPDIAIAVVVENQGEGSDYAAPIFRRMVELYFMGQPQVLYWWETAFNVPYTPTSQYTQTPELEIQSTPSQ